MRVTIYDKDWGIRRYKFANIFFSLWSKYAFWTENDFGAGWFILGISNTISEIPGHPTGRPP